MNKGVFIIGLLVSYALMGQIPENPCNLRMSKNPFLSGFVEEGQRKGAVGVVFCRENGEYIQVFNWNGEGDIRVSTLQGRYHPADDIVQPLAIDENGNSLKIQNGRWNAGGQVLHFTDRGNRYWYDPANPQQYTYTSNSDSTVYNIRQRPMEKYYIENGTVRTVDIYRYNETFTLLSIQRYQYPSKKLQYVEYFHSLNQVNPYRRETYNDSGKIIEDKNLINGYEHLKAVEVKYQRVNQNSTQLYVLPRELQGYEAKALDGGWVYYSNPENQAEYLCAYSAEGNLLSQWERMGNKVIHIILDCDPIAQKTFEQIDNFNLILHQLVLDSGNLALKGELLYDAVSGISVDNTRPLTPPGPQERAKSYSVGGVQYEITLTGINSIVTTVQSSENQPPESLRITLNELENIRGTIELNKNKYSPVGMLLFPTYGASFPYFGYATEKFYWRESQPFSRPQLTVSHFTWPRDLSQYDLVYSSDWYEGPYNSYTTVLKQGLDIKKLFTETTVGVYQLSFTPLEDNLYLWEVKADGELLYYAYVFWLFE